MTCELPIIGRHTRPSFTLTPIPRNTSISPLQYAGYYAFFCHGQIRAKQHQGYHSTLSQERKPDHRPPTTARNVESPRLPVLRPLWDPSGPFLVCLMAAPGATRSTCKGAVTLELASCICKSPGQGSIADRPKMNAGSSENSAVSNMAMAGGRNHLIKSPLPAGRDSSLPFLGLAGYSHPGLPTIHFSQDEPPRHLPSFLSNSPFTELLSLPSASCLFP